MKVHREAPYVALMTFLRESIRSFARLRAISTRSFSRSANQQICGYYFSNGHRPRAALNGLSFLEKRNVLHISPGFVAAKVPALVFCPLGRSFASAPDSLNYYNLLGVDPSASATEIKKAYFKKAKETHPDLNKDDPNAKERFQKINDIYSVLKDKSKRDEYDEFLRSDESMDFDEYKNYEDSSYAEHEDMFQRVWAQYGVEEYLENVEMELEAALQSGFRHGNWGPICDFGIKHKLLILGIVVPLAIIIRYPGLVMLCFRFLISFPIRVVQSMPPSFTLSLLWRLWKSTVAQHEGDTKQKTHKRGNQRQSNARAQKKLPRIAKNFILYVRFLSRW